MPYYMTRFRYDKPQYKALVDKPQDRSAAARQIVEAHGGTMREFFFTFGEYDGFVITEFPDQESATACLFAIAAGGAVMQETTVLFTAEQAKKAMEKAGSVASGYRPPSG